MTIIEKARSVFADRESILTNAGMTRKELRLLRRRGYLTSAPIRVVEHAPLSDKPTGTSIRLKWMPTSKLTEAK